MPFSFSDEPGSSDNGASSENSGTEGQSISSSDGQYRSRQDGDKESQSEEQGSKKRGREESTMMPYPTSHDGDRGDSPKTMAGHDMMMWHDMLGPSRKPGWGGHHPRAAESVLFPPQGGMSANFHEAGGWQQQAWYARQQEMRAAHRNAYFPVHHLAAHPGNLGEAHSYPYQGVGGGIQGCGSGQPGADYAAHGAAGGGYECEWHGSSPFWGFGEAGAAVRGNSRNQNAGGQGQHSLGGSSVGGGDRAGERGSVDGYCAAGGQPGAASSHYSNHAGAIVMALQQAASQLPSSSGKGSGGSSSPPSSIGDSDAPSPPSIAEPTTPHVFQKGVHGVYQHRSQMQAAARGTLSPNSTGGGTTTSTRSPTGATSSSGGSANHANNVYMTMGAHPALFKNPALFKSCHQQAEARGALSVTERNMLLERENELLRGMLARDKEETMALVNLLIVKIGERQTVGRDP